MKRKIVMALSAAVLTAGLYTVGTAVFCPAQLQEVQAAQADPLAPKLTSSRFSFEGEVISGSLYTAYEKNQRYYLPLDYFAAKEAGTYLLEGEIAALSMGGQEYALAAGNTAYLLNGEERALLNKPMLQDGKLYVSLADLLVLFDYVSFSDYETLDVRIFKNRSPRVQTNLQAEDGKTALIRLEDVMFDGQKTTENRDHLLKLRAMGDALYAKAVPFHVAWIPRYINPPKQLDNDLLTDFGIQNVDYVYALDYLRYSGGQMGLHGYTHQSGKTVSAAGADFGKKASTSKEEAAKRMKQAINVADKLEIPYTFFEFPHYDSTAVQRRVAEKLFPYIYEAYDGNSMQTIKAVNGSKYVPTPMDYVHSSTKVNEFYQLQEKTIAEGSLGSFFFHQAIENPYMQVQFLADGENPDAYPEGYPTVTVQPNSVLNTLIDRFVAGGYRFRYITEF